MNDGIKNRFAFCLITLSASMILLVFSSAALAAGKCGSRSKLLKFAAEYEVKKTQYGHKIMNIRPTTPLTYPIGYGFTLEAKLYNPRERSPLYIKEIFIKGPGIKNR